jgi:formylmethanofuran dehydrogenase subunit C
MTRLVLKAEPPLRLALDGLLPRRLAGLSLREIERLPLQLGNRRQAVGDWFRVEEGERETLFIAGDCRRLDRIGAGMSEGSIAVEGDVGAYLGVSMSGGAISVAGSAGHGAATDLNGGALRITGDAGDALAGALPGAASGMRGGLVIVRGSVGARAGQRLKRGLVVIGGQASTGCGAEMIAGTILLAGRLGRHAGAAMRRGSIIALGGAEEIGSTFVDCGVHDLLFLRLLASHLASLGLDALAARLAPLRRWAGDLAVGGKGELLLPA